MGLRAPPEISHDEQVERRLRVLYTHELRERQIFMHELKEHRKKKEKKLMRRIKDAVGPRWYQELSVQQRAALDSLKIAMHKDSLSGRPLKTAVVLRELGLYPRPACSDIMTCIYSANEDPMLMISQLYYLTYGYSIEVKRASYALNARLMLSAILHLGMDNLIHLLREKFRFRPEEIVEELSQKKNKKRKPHLPLASPYLQKLVAALWEKPVYKRPPPPPLPNLDSLDDPYEEVAVITKPPPPPPPPPPPKKRLPREYCDKMAGIDPLRIKQPSESSLMKKKGIKPSRRKNRVSSHMSLSKKVYGMSLGFRKKTTRRRKPVAPSTNVANSEFMITGVYEINGKTMYILASVCVLPAEGELIHGGHARVRDQHIQIHCGYRGQSPPKKRDPCDCLKVWQDPVFKYLNNSKCYCGHNYDFYNEGTFPPDELPFFLKPTSHSPMHFNYQTIFDLDKKHLEIEKTFKKIWETDSVLRVDDGTLALKDDKKKKKKRSSKTCLGPTPKPQDYLRCALRFMRDQNIAACLPDLHLVPELVEWMRRRIYGPLSQQDKKELLRESNTFWICFAQLARKGFGHVYPPKLENYDTITWLNKQKLCKSFKSLTQKYKVAIYRSYAYTTNLFWRSMFHAEVPDKKFREIYFSYLFGKLDDLLLLNPYNYNEVNERKTVLMDKRYVCLPEGCNLDG